MKMMVVDDAIQICSGIRDGIEWDRYGIGEVYAAYDGVSALKLFVEHTPEAVKSSSAARRHASYCSAPIRSSSMRGRLCAWACSPTSSSR